MKIQHWFFFKRHPENIPKLQVLLGENKTKAGKVNNSIYKLHTSNSEQDILDACWAANSVKSKIHNKFFKRVESNKKTNPQSNVRLVGKKYPFHKRTETLANKLVVLIEETIKPLSKSRVSFQFNSSNKIQSALKSYRAEPLKKANDLKEQLKEITTQLDSTLDLSCITQRPRRTRKERLIRNTERIYKTSVLQDNKTLNNTELFTNPHKEELVTRNSFKKELKIKHSTVNDKTSLDNKVIAKENIKAMQKVASKNDLKPHRMVPDHKRCLTRMSLLEDMKAKAPLKNKQANLKPKLITENKKTIPKHQHKKGLQTDNSSVCRMKV